MNDMAKLFSIDGGNRLIAGVAILGIALLGTLFLAKPLPIFDYHASGHDPFKEKPPQAASYPPMAEDAATGASFIHDFGDGHDPTRWYKSNFSYPSGHPAWLSRLIHFYDDRIELEVRRMRVGNKKIAGAEYQRRGFYSFGRYEVVMRAAPGSGTVSALFTHTHQQFGDQHDEIDIEFLGKNLRMVTGNYFTDGKPHDTIPMPLPFDASEEIHLYAFEWEPDEIRWYADDMLLHTATPEDHPIPQSPGRVMVHLWSGGPAQYNWHGRPTFEDGARAAFYCISYQKAGEDAPQCSDTFDPVAANAAKKDG